MDRKKIANILFYIAIAQVPVWCVLFAIALAIPVPTYKQSMEPIVEIWVLLTLLIALAAGFLSPPEANDHSRQSA